MKPLCLFAVLFSFYISNAQWNPDAGVVKSYTDTAILSATSGINLNLITDGDDDTNWVSGAPFPTSFISRSDQNTFLTQAIQYPSSSLIDSTKITDANLNTATTVMKNAGVAKLEMEFEDSILLKFLSIKLAADSAIQIYAFTTENDSILVNEHLAADNFQLLRYELSTDFYTKLRFTSRSNFMIYEVAALSSNPKESITVDLGEIKSVGKVYARHWCGVMNGLPNAEKVVLQISQDQQNWEVIANLIPNALPIIVTDLEEEMQARYIRVEYTLRAVDFLKVFFWEIDVYDENGKYGAIPTAQASTVTIAEMLGISGIWGWGNNKYSDLLPAGQGAFLYAPVFSNARNYHNMTWDVLDPDNATDFNTMGKGGGTEVFPWLNWDREYQQWKNSGMDVQVSIQFAGFQDTVWNNPLNAAYDYGLDFAKHFGADSGGNNLVSLLEVGNEPWNYDSIIYQQILHGMASGVKAGDPNMKVIPCALQASDPEAELANSPFNNYIGNRILPETAPFLDGLNSHIYSYDNRPDGMRYASYPEHINSSMREILNLIRFRDANMPNKPIYCTEWGWDHAGNGAEDCTHDECVSEQSAAVYAVRGALFLLRLGMERAIWYFYGDTKTTSSLYTRSGVTGSIRNNFIKKDSYRSLQTLVNAVGEKKFLSVLQENDTAWVYLLGDTLNQPTHIVAWRPIEGDNLATIEIDVTGNYIPLSALKIDGKSDKGSVTTLPQYKNGSISLAVNSIPTLIRIDSCLNCPQAVIVKVKALLEGAYNTNEMLMNSDLNDLELLPLSPPQASTDSLGARIITADIFLQTGTNVVVDWINVELWTGNQKLATRAALLLRDGNVVDVDGVSPVIFYGFASGTYDVVLRHRNHLSIRTKEAVLLSGW